jgi:hypothetical protein
VFANIRLISHALKTEGAEGGQAVSLSVAEKYVEAFAGIAKESNTVIVPSNIGDVSGMVTQVMSVMKGVQKAVPK